MINIGKLRELVNKQAEDEMLWSVPLNKLPTIHEEYLKRHIRYLHAIIEEHETFYDDEINKYLNDNQSQ